MATLSPQYGQLTGCSLSSGIVCRLVVYVELNDSKVRVIGSLIEKSIVTPDQYPMTLNALTNACNQKSSRKPIMSLTQGEVQHTIRELTDKYLIRTEENFRGRVDKYAQRFCNTRYSDLQFSDGELRSRSSKNA